MFSEKQKRPLKRVLMSLIHSRTMRKFVQKEKCEQQRKNRVTYPSSECDSLLVGEYIINRTLRLKK